MSMIDRLPARFKKASHRAEPLRAIHLCATNYIGRQLATNLPHRTNDWKNADAVPSATSTFRTLLLTQPPHVRHAELNPTGVRGRGMCGWSQRMLSAADADGCEAGHSGDTRSGQAGVLSKA
jgi:hypothetical protein